MTQVSRLEQEFTDELGTSAERTFEIYRSWAAEHELEVTEERLRAEGVTRSPLPLADVRGRWVAVAALILVGLSAIFFVQVARVLIAVYGS